MFAGKYATYSQNNNKLYIQIFQDEGNNNKVAIRRLPDALSQFVVTRMMTMSTNNKAGELLEGKLTLAEQNTRITTTLVCSHNFSCVCEPLSKVVFYLYDFFTRM